MSRTAGGNWFCGFITKRSRSNGTAQFPACGDASSPQDGPNAGYNFMSVLSHSRAAGPPFPVPPSANPSIPTRVQLSHRPGTTTTRAEHAHAWDSRSTGPLRRSPRVPGSSLERLERPALRRHEDYVLITRSTYQIRWAGPDLGRPEPAPFCDENAVHSRSAAPSSTRGTPTHPNRGSRRWGRAHSPSRPAGSRHVIYRVGTLGANSTPCGGPTSGSTAASTWSSGGGGTIVTPSSPPISADDGHGSANVPLNGRPRPAPRDAAQLLVDLNSTNPGLYTISNRPRPRQCEHAQPRRGGDGDRDAHRTGAGSPPARRGLSPTRRPAARCGETWAP